MFLERLLLPYYTIRVKSLKTITMLTPSELHILHLIISFDSEWLLQLMGFNLLATDFLFQILAHPVFKM